MRIVIDTNVLVSAAVIGRNPEAVILFVVESPDCEWVVSAEILKEYKEVLSRSRLRLTESQQQRWFNILDSATIMIEVNVEIDFPRDRKDAKFIACAIAGEVDFLITGDHDFTEAENLTSTTIISVSLFKKLVDNLRE
ncbi:putative toxin-antitoxin system toxin component, PIN family [Ancylothrix sp. C2]|uniref:putative toxin-antitoxin system toxin component, PIN family n=1 Tax=Ancylothrix sp. D3o TaxID=2953691 RepID=UPI0021BA71DD|nr:putative toxin-antitoxin system toxin component, PIN family [Ancylothrix sp. D3o]MCT7950734.1 putative toxin-antitoxin system toxin component, PIN family [Ancylothrix sp. D3o]